MAEKTMNQKAESGFISDTAIIAIKPENRLRKVNRVGIFIVF